MKEYPRLKRALVVVTLLACCLLFVRAIAGIISLPALVQDPLYYFPLFFQVGLTLIVLLAGWWYKALSRRVIQVVVAIIVVNLVMGCGLYFPSAPATESSVIRMMTYNIFQARWVDERLFDLIDEQNPDLLLLQEVPHSYYLEHESDLRQRYKYVYYAKNVVTASRFEFVETQAVTLAWDRALNRVRIRHPAGLLEVFNLHFSHPSPTRFFERLNTQREQVAQTRERLDRTDLPFVVAGDFNIPVGSTLYHEFASHYRAARNMAGPGFNYTFPSYLPVTPIDHVFGKGVQFRSFQPLSSFQSDHRPVVCEFVVEP